MTATEILPGSPLAAARPRRVTGPGLVGVIAQDTARFTAFAVSLTRLSAPAGTAIGWKIGHSIAAQCNLLARDLLANPAAEWLWILGDDHEFAPGLLDKLLADDRDIVAPLCLGRTPPYQPVACTGFIDGGPRRRRLDLSDHPDGGVVEVHSTGSAGMLIRRDVLEAMDDPWFEAGNAAGVEIGEDYYWCDKASAAGYSVHVDLDAALGHVTTATVWPTRSEEGWSYRFGFAGGMDVTMPPDPWATIRDTNVEGAR